MYKIVLIRHGESEWNLKNQFTGWVDVDLAPSGVQEAVEAGEVLKKEGYISSYEVDTTGKFPQIKITTKVVNRSPAITGPATEPSRPTAKAQPEPVAR